MSANRSVKPSATNQAKQAPVDDLFDDDEEVPYYEWNEMLKKDGEGEEATEYFDDSVLEAGTAEPKTSKDDPSVTYSTVPMSCRYLTATGEVTGVFYFEMPEKVYPYGVSCTPQKGKINYSLMTRFSKTDPTDIQFVDVFTAGIYSWFANKTHEGGWHYQAGGDDEFDLEKPGKYLRPWIRYPKDPKTKKPMTDRDKQWYITMLNGRDEKTVITAPFAAGQKGHPIEWKRLENMSLTMIVTVQCASVYLGSGKVCPQFRAASAIISKRPKRGGKVINTKRANQLAKDNPGLAPSINHVIDTIEVDNPSFGDGNGFTSSVKGGEGEEGGEGDEFITTTKVGGRGRGTGVEGFINSSKMRGGASTGRGGATGRGGSRGGGTTVINRKPPPTPSKVPVYEEGGEEESYE